MTEPRSRPRRGLRSRAAGATLAVALMVVGALLVQPLDLPERLGLIPGPADPAASSGGTAGASPDATPTSEPPDGAASPEVPTLQLPAVDSPVPVARALRPRRADPAAVRRALEGLVRARRLGPRVAVHVRAAGRAAYDVGPERVIPASTLKLLTAVAALHALGPDHRFTTRVVRRGRTLTLVGGGDPLLGRVPQPDVYPRRADLQTLSRATARRLPGGRPFRLTYDASLFSGPAISPDWEADYVPTDVVSPISALWVDEGREQTGLAARSDDPAASAAGVFAADLRRAGVRLHGAVVPGVAEAAAQPVARVAGAPVAQVVQRALEVSDNEASEVLARHVALASGVTPDFDGATQAVTAALRTLGVRTAGTRLEDGSGLSRGNRLAGRTVLDVLDVAASTEHPELRPVVAGLPVAGFNGSLALRFQSAASVGLGAVRAKTGTLDGVHGLAGVATSADGVLLGFTAVVDRVRERNALFARDRLDQIATALAACVCGAG